jgi:hypothetical protein
MEEMDIESPRKLNANWKQIYLMLRTKRMMWRQWIDRYQWRPPHTYLNSKGKVAICKDNRCIRIVLDDDTARRLIFLKEIISIHLVHPGPQILFILTTKERKDAIDAWLRMNTPKAYIEWLTHGEPRMGRLPWTLRYSNVPLLNNVWETTPPPPPQPILGYTHSEWIELCKDTSGRYMDKIPMRICISDYPDGSPIWSHYGIKSADCHWRLTNYMYLSSAAEEYLYALD